MCHYSQRFIPKFGGFWGDGGERGGVEREGGLGFVSHSERGSKGVFDSANGAITRQKGALGGSERAQPRLHQSGNEKKAIYKCKWATFWEELEKILESDKYKESCAAGKLTQDKKKAEKTSKT